MAERDLAVRIPTGTIVKLLAVALLVWMALQLVPILFLVVIAILIAVALDPLANRLEQRGLSRGGATLVIALALAGVFAFVFTVITPRIATELAAMSDDLPRLQADVHRALRDHPFVDRAATQAFELPKDPAFRASLGDSWTVGHAAIEVVASFGIVVVLSLYFLLEGKRLYVWLLAYVPRSHRERMADTIPEVSDVMRAYIQGQAVTSLMFAVFTGALLWWLEVPAWLPLAVLAAVCDVIPFLGILVMLAVAGALALTVTPWTAIVVVVALALYHLVESYVIIPAVYGKKLRLSTLAVILALLVGGVLGGVIGAVLVLPFVAAYPIVERIWLHGFLSEEVLEDHASLEEAAKSGSDEQVDEAIEAVQRGDSPPPLH